MGCGGGLEEVGLSEHKQFGPRGPLVGCLSAGDQHKMWCACVGGWIAISKGSEISFARGVVEG